MELLLRDEAQQLGTPGSNTILAHIRHALDVMIGDHRQSAGGSRPNYHYVTELLEQKTCGLNAVPADLCTPATLPAALLRQTHNSAGPWKKGQGDMPSWGKPNLHPDYTESGFSANSMLEAILCLSLSCVKPKQAETVMQVAGLKASRLLWVQPSIFRFAHPCASPGNFCCLVCLPILGGLPFRVEGTGSLSAHAARTQFVASARETATQPCWQVDGDASMGPCA